VSRVLDRLDAGALRRWARDALDRLGSHRDEIDGLNVFPVPDGDTGTNLYLTVESAVAEVERVPEQEDLGKVADALAAGALHGARGSSGVILSQLLRGVADALREHPDGGAGAVRTALARAADSAYGAVSRPAEGTMLSVARAAAEGARGANLREVVSGALAAAHTALDRTPSQLDQLGRAGVVDAGGRGLLLVLESLAGTVAGRRGPRGPGAREVGRAPARPAAEPAPVAPDGPPFEVMYLVDAPESAVPPLREALEAIGESVVVVGGPGAVAGSWKVHVHTADVAGALAAGDRAAQDRAAGDRASADRVAGDREADATGCGESGGGPRQVRVAPVLRRAAIASGSLAAGAPAVAVVAVANGAGLAGLLAASGALVIVRRPGSAPTPEDLLRAVRDTGAAAVVVVPDDAESAAAAAAAVAAAAEVVRASSAAGAASATGREAGAASPSAARAGAAGARGASPEEARGAGPGAAREAGPGARAPSAAATLVDAAPSTFCTVGDRTPEVAVLPPCAPVAALAALAVHDPAQPLAAALDRMSAAAAATRQGAVTTARCVGVTPVGPCRPGDALGLVGTDVVAVGADAATVGRVVADRLLGSGGELLTVLRGHAAEAGPAATALCRAVRQARPDVEVHALDGGQDGALLLLGVE
jgi:uncharacterized protein